MAKKLKYMPYAQARVHSSLDYIILTSYNTDVLLLSADNRLIVQGLYSQTIKRHISAFLKEYCSTVTYQTAEWLYKNNKQLDIATGEVIDL